MNLLPFFVYGTLLPGQPNYSLWGQSLVVEEPARFPRGRLFDMGFYPMLVEGYPNTVKGMLMSVDAEIGRNGYAELQQRIDALEGYQPEKPDEGVYRRVKRTVHRAAGGSVTAWVYVGTVDSALKTAFIRSGDWVAHSASDRPSIAAWWAEFGAELHFGNSA